MLSPEILAECFPIWPQHCTYSRIFGIFQDIRHIPENLEYSRKWSGIFQDIWHIPRHQAYSRKSVILQEICYLPKNLAYSRKSSIYLPVNMPSSRKSGIFQDIKHISGNQGTRSWTFFKCVLSAPDQVNNLLQFGHMCLCFSCIL